MAFELYYTSAPEGLKRGASGFCTVAATDGIPRVLGERLESLSAYRHHFAAGTGENPISFAHSLVNVSGTAYHVLSRICDAGVDHTQRTNAFAHHLVVGAREMTAAAGGPAWLLLQPGVMAESWDGNVGTLPPRTLPAGGSAPGSVCRLWKDATGDPGWAGRLADSFVASTAGTPVCILFPPGQNMLPLLAEAIALLPPELRWSVTFNTYFTTMPTSATCLWRCCLAGTPAAQTGARYAANGLILDLTAANLGPAPTGPYAEYARTGRGCPSPASTAKRAVAATTRAAATGAYDLAEPDPESPPVPPTEPLLEEAPSSPRPPPDRRRRKPVQIDVLEEITGRDTASAHARRRRQILWLFGGALLAIAAGMTIVWLTARNLAPPPLDNADNQTADTHATHLPIVNLPPVPSPIGSSDSQPGTSPTVAAQPVTPPKPPPPLNDGPLIALPGDLNAPAPGTG
ncbi:MAG TPA: hypothetical protein VHQ47_06560, partial [Phycisphaerae bacterium]|nr:hypothetical protein [Phycisphaerae bacterium]